MTLRGIWGIRISTVRRRKRNRSKEIRRRPKKKEQGRRRARRLKSRGIQMELFARIVDKK